MTMPSPSLLAHLVVVVAVLLVSSWGLLGADAAVHDYTGERFSRYGNAFVLHGGSEGVYASAAAAGAFIRFEKVVFKRTPESAERDGNRTATVTAVVFEAGDREAVGGTTDVSGSGGDRVLCCTPAMARRGDCTEGALAYRAARESNGWPRVLAASFPPGGLDAAFPDETVAVSRTGMYTLLFVRCDSDAGDGQAAYAYAAEGSKTIWKNGRGSYLPGRMAPLVPVYGCASLAFAALAAYWFAQHARFWRAAAIAPPLQGLATAVIALGMAESAARYLDLVGLDESGVRPRGATLLAATAGALRGAVARVLAVLVATGHGVVRPAAMAGMVSARVAGLGAAFFAAAEALEVSENVGAVSDHYPSSPARRLVLALLVAVLNAVFVYWIFSSLSKTMSKLKARRMTLKLETYRKFNNALIIAVALSLGWITFEIHFNSTDEHNERWRVAWVIPAVWQLISFSLLCTVCLIWAPSQGSTRLHAYSEAEEGVEDCDDVLQDDDTRPLIRPGPLSYVDSWAISVSQDDTKVILRTDSGVYYARAKAPADGDDKRV